MLKFSVTEWRLCALFKKHIIISRSVPLSPGCFVVCFYVLAQRALVLCSCFYKVCKCLSAETVYTSQSPSPSPPPSTARLENLCGVLYPELQVKNIPLSTNMNSVATKGVCPTRQWSADLSSLFLCRNSISMLSQNPFLFVYFCLP